MVRKNGQNGKIGKQKKATGNIQDQNFGKIFWKNRQNSGSNFGKSLERQKTAKMGYPIRTFRT
jgi:hypothetical protein